MFNQAHNVDTRMAVIEEKFSLYEKMMDKLESAIQTISEANQNISRMLSVHQEKIDVNVKCDDILFDKIRELEDKNSKEHQKVLSRVESFENFLKDLTMTEKQAIEEQFENLTEKINSIGQFRWVFVGGLAVIVFIFSNSAAIVNILTPDPSPANIERAK